MGKTREYKNNHIKSMKRMKRILMISSDNNTNSGAFRSMVKLSESINSNGTYDVTVVLPKRGNGQELLEKAKIHYRKIRSFGWTIKVEDKNNVKAILISVAKALLNIIAIIRICRLIKQQNIDIVHINTIYSYVGAIAAIITKRKIVWHIREAIEDSQSRCLVSGRCYKLINRADVVICISDFVKKYYIGRIDERKTVVIYNGVDPNVFYNREKNILSRRIITFLNIGNMTYNKGQETVILAAKNLVDEGITDFNILFVGVGDKEKEYRTLTQKYGLDSTVVFMGSQKDVRPFFQQSDVLIASGTSEAFGRTTVEGMMEGCLIIGNNTGATPYILKNGEFGLLYENNDVSSLVNAMRMVMNGKTSRFINIAESGQEYALKMFSSEINYKRILELYEGIIGLVHE